MLNAWAILIAEIRESLLVVADPRNVFF